MVHDKDLPIGVVEKVCRVLLSKPTTTWQ